SVCWSSAPSLRFNPMPPRTSQKSCRPRVSHRIMVGTLANRFACVACAAEGVEHHRVMKPSSGNHRLGWSRWNTRRAPDGQDQNPSRTEMGLDASDNIHVSSEGRGRIFLLTSPFIGQLNSSEWAIYCEHSVTSADVCLSVGVIERETNRATSLGRPRLEMKSVLPQ